MKLAGRTALVTGTSPNIGAGIAIGLAAAGASVVCADRNRAFADGAAREIETTGGRALGVEVDVADEASVAKLFDAAERVLGIVDVVVNNAVVFDQRGILDMPLAAWRTQLGVILDGAFLCTREAARRMIRAGRQGSIVNVISTAGHQGQPGNVGYCTGKSGLLNFTRSIAMELASHGIRVNSLTPTATDPSEGAERAERFGAKPTPPEVFAVFEKFRRGVPMQRLPKPSDYVGAVVFLCSDDAAMITGADLRVDGGALARYWAWNPIGD